MNMDTRHLLLVTDTTHAFAHYFVKEDLKGVKGGKAGQDALLWAPIHVKLEISEPTHEQNSI